MKLIVISPEGSRADEVEVVRLLFAAGLARYHVRKPSWSVGEMRRFLSQFHAAERASLVLHSHHELVPALGLGGTHYPARHADVQRATRSFGLASRACHSVPELAEALGGYDAVFISPLFPSISKPGHGAGQAIDHEALQGCLRSRNENRAATQVIGLGGIDASRVESCRALGLDGIAVLGAVWNARDPVAAFLQLQARCTANLREPVDRQVPAAFALMCLTQDGLAQDHVQQAEQLCAAGVRWIQLRMKNAPDVTWLETATAVVRVCRAHAAICIVNDSVDITLKANADGVHLGKTDLAWSKAREQIGPGKILGGTVNNVDDARAAVQAGCLDYVGVGPWRFTANKQNLAPLLGAEGVRRVIRELGNLPAWVIGGIEPGDLGDVHATGAAGVAVSSALFKGGAVSEAVRRFRSAWPIASAPDETGAPGSPPLS